MFKNSVTSKEMLKSDFSLKILTTPSYAVSIYISLTEIVWKKEIFKNE